MGLNHSCCSQVGSDGKPECGNYELSGALEADGFKVVEKSWRLRERWEGSSGRLRKMLTKGSFYVRHLQCTPFKVSFWSETCIRLKQILIFISDQTFSRWFICGKIYLAMRGWEKLKTTPAKHKTSVTDDFHDKNKSKNYYLCHFLLHR